MAERFEPTPFGSTDDILDYFSFLPLEATLKYYITVKAKSVSAEAYIESQAFLYITLSSPHILL